MSPNPRRQERLELVRQALDRGFRPERLDVRQYNSASIRVRVVDPRFAGRTRVEREAMVLPAINALPADVQTDITMLLLLAPDELARSLMNVEFEDPLPTHA